MQFFATLQALALLATGALAMPNNMEAADLAARTLEARVDCSRILPACNGGRVVGQTNCRCRGQKETCDLWTCPGGAPNTVSPVLKSLGPYFFLEWMRIEHSLIKSLLHTDGLWSGRHRMRLDLREG